MSEALDIARILTFRGHLGQRDTVRNILQVDGDVMPGIKDPDQLPRQVPILSSSPDATNDVRGVFRHIFTSAALTQVTDAGTAREIMTNHDRHVRGEYNNYANAIRSQGGRPLTYEQIQAGGLVNRPQGWSTQRFRNMMDGIADLQNNEIGFTLGAGIGNNYDRNALAGRVGNVLQNTGGKLARFNADNTQSRIQTHRITPTQNGKIQRRVAQLQGRAQAPATNPTATVARVPPVGVRI